MRVATHEETKRENLASDEGAWPAQLRPYFSPGGSPMYARRFIPARPFFMELVSTPVAVVAILPRRGYGPDVTVLRRPDYADKQNKCPFRPQEQGERPDIHLCQGGCDLRGSRQAEDTVREDPILQLEALQKPPKKRHHRKCVQVSVMLLLLCKDEEPRIVSSHGH
ncbi:hypothetical protein MRX96_012712 [Rhipicephalus microplus]